MKAAFFRRGELDFFRVAMQPGMPQGFGHSEGKPYFGLPGNPVSVFVSFEVFILAVNRWRCPLTAVAARYTADRRPNFDIYLPEWLARHNKGIFGTLFVLGLLFTLARWNGWLG